MSSSCTQSGCRRVVFLYFVPAEVLPKLRNGNCVRISTAYHTPSYFHAVDLYAEWPGSILCCCTCCTALVVGSAWLHAILSDMQVLFGLLSKYMLTVVIRVAVQCVCSYLLWAADAQVMSQFTFQFHLHLSPLTSSRLPIIIIIIL